MIASKRDDEDYLSIGLALDFSFDPLTSSCDGDGSCGGVGVTNVWGGSVMVLQMFRHMQRTGMVRTYIMLRSGLADGEK
jgi:hypothetical protein